MLLLYISKLSFRMIKLMENTHISTWNLKRGTVMLENLTHVGAKMVGIKNLRLELKNWGWFGSYLTLPSFDQPWWWYNTVFFSIKCCQIHQTSTNGQKWVGTSYLRLVWVLVGPHSISPTLEARGQSWPPRPPDQWVTKEPGSFQRPTPWKLHISAPV